MAKLSAEEIYERHSKPLSVAKRPCLIEVAVHDLAIWPAENESPRQHDWISV